MQRFSRVLSLVTALTSLLAASPVLAQTAPAGIVTAVHGTATIARAANNQTSPLRFKDDVFLHDRVATGERSLARILLGGKAVVTAREHSILTITAVPGAATLDLESGRLLLAVSKGAMRPGESIDIKTRNAIIGIRGTVVVADFAPGEAADGSGDATVFTILRGVVEVSQVDPLAAHSVGAPLRLGALQSVKLMGTRFPEVTSITAEQAKRMTQGFTVPIRLTPETSKEVARAHAAQVGEALTALLPPSGVPLHGQSDSSLRRSERNVLRNDGTSRPTSVGGVTSGTTGSLVNATTGALTGVTGALTGVTAPVTGTLSGVTGTLTGVTGPVTGALTGTLSGVTGALTGVTAPVTGTLTGTLSGVTAPVTGTLSGVTSALTGTTGLLAPTPTPAPSATPTTSAPSSSSSGSSGLLGTILKTTGSLLK